MEAAGLGAGLFADVDANPSDINAAAGVAAYRAGGYDGVIAFGGGSGLDLAKTVAFMAGQTRPIWDFEDIGDWWTRADPDAIAPVVAVPTTAGTGSEVGRASVITNSQTHEKKIVFSPQDAASTGHHGPRTDRGNAQVHNSGDRSGRVCALR